MSNKGILFVMMQPPAGLEEEFNAWYDTEHIPERAGIPGFETARRFVCISGFPRFLAIYDLAHLGVLDTPDYLRFVGDNFTPWTKRITSRVKIDRMIGEQVYPGGALTGSCARLVTLRFRNCAEGQDTIVEGLRRNFEGRPETLKLRTFICGNGKRKDVLGIVELRAPIPETLDLAAFGRYSDALDLFNVYANY